MIVGGGLVLGFYDFLGFLDCVRWFDYVLLEWLEFCFEVFV